MWKHGVGRWEQGTGARGGTSGPWEGILLGCRGCREWVGAPGVPLGSRVWADLKVGRGKGRGATEGCAPVIRQGPQGCPRQRPAPERGEHREKDPGQSEDRGTVLKARLTPCPTGRDKCPQLHGWGSCAITRRRCTGVQVSRERRELS